MEIKDEIYIQEWNVSILNKIIEFWEERGIVFIEKNESTLVGKRGSIWGNLTSFNMRKLLTKLKISFDDEKIIYSLQINTIFQKITEYNKAWWELECKSFDNYIRFNDKLENEWKEFLPEYKDAGIIWALTLGIKEKKRK